MRIYSIFLIFFYFLFANQLFAQIGADRDYASRYGGTQQSSSDSLPTDINIAPDTFNFHYFYTSNLGKDFPYQDTLIHHFQYHDPVQQETWDYGMTGNLGGAHFPIVYQPPVRRGFDIGLHQFDLYKIDYDQFAYFRLRKAFTKLYFTQGDTQEDTYTKATFSRNFAKGINLSLDYKRINQKGQYQNQASENTSLAIGIWYKSPNQRYDAFTTYVSNAIFQEENGGINQDQLNETNIADAFSVPVQLSSGISNTAHTERAIHFQQQFRFNPEKPVRPRQPVRDSIAILIDSIMAQRDSIMIHSDSIMIHSDSIMLQRDSTMGQTDSMMGQRNSTITRKRNRSFAFGHHGQFQVAKYKFSDTNPDTTFYGDLQIDDRGLRYFIRDRILENTFTLNTSKLREGKGFSSKKQKDLLEVGIRNTIHFLHQEPKDTVITNLFLQGRWNFSPSERLDIQTYADLGLIDNAGDYRLSGELFFDLEKAGRIKATALHQSYSPNLIQHRHYVSQQPLWQNDWQKTFETSIALTYSLPRFKLELTGQYHLIDHYIFYNTEGVADQYNSPLSIGQLTVKKDFRFWKFTLENDITLQQVSKNVLALPEIYSKHSFYFEGKIFKRVLFIRLGADVRINTPYFANSYQPLTGQFHIQKKEEIDWYPSIDAFITFRVKNFRFFVKQTNLFGFFTDDFNFQVQNYPQPYPHLRFGVSWQFLD